MAMAVFPPSSTATDLPEHTHKELDKFSTAQLKKPKNWVDECKF